MGKLQNKKIEIKNEKYIKLFAVEVLCITILTLGFDLTEQFDSWWGYRLSFVVVYFALGLAAWLFHCKLFKEKNDKLEISSKSVLIGIALVVPCYLGKLIAVDIPRGIIFDNAFVITDLKNTIWYIFFYIFIVGVFEEYIFRVCCQRQLELLLGKMQIFAPVCSAALFGAWHLIFGWPEQAVMSFIVGLVLGYSKKYFKSCTFASVVLAHGLYDILVSFILI